MRGSRTIWTASVITIVLVASAGGARGAPFYERPFDPSQFLLGSNAGGVEQQVADDFVLSGNQTLGHITWWGGVVGAARETQLLRTCVVRLFTSAGAQPAAAPFYEQFGIADVTDTGVSSTYPGWNPEFKISRYDLDLPPVQLSSGTTYWASVLNADPTTPAGTQWCWYAAAYAPGGSVFRRDGDADGWISVTENVRNEMSVALFAPEPAAPLSAFCCLILLTRRRDAATANHGDDAGTAAGRS